MRKLLLIFVSVFMLCISVSAQTNTSPACPTISVLGPAGIVGPNETIRYTAEIDPKGLDLKYSWSVSAGTIISGQGTTGIEVKAPKPNSLTVTIDVAGVPNGCPRTVSETAIWTAAPEAVKLAQFDGSLFKGDKLELNMVVREMNDNPNNQLYVYFAYKNEPADEAALKREHNVSDYLATAIGDRSRMTIVRVFSGVDLVQFWRIPPGADNPRCDECAESSCPTISVVGPAGITEPGSTMTFSANPPLKDFERLNYKWTVSVGTIVEGQGKPGITVQTTREMCGQNVIATVEIDGLLKECPNTATESASVAPIRDFFPSDEFGKLPLNEEKGRLDSFLHELLVAKGQIGYIVLRFKKGTTAAKLRLRIKRIKNHIVFRKFPKYRIVILTEPSEAETTVLWRAGPEFGEIICPVCKTY